MNKNKNAEKFDIAYENLAMPEIHTGQVETKTASETRKEEITYNTVAIPEIHIRKKSGGQTSGKQ